MSIHTQIENHIAAIAQPLMNSGLDNISPATIADEVDRRIDPDNLSPEEKTYASRMYIRHEVRKYLARNYDPVERLKTAVNDQQSDLFSDLLQDYYPVKRSIDGEDVLVYTRRERLNQEDAARLAERMQKAGKSLIEHARALVVFVNGREAA